MTVSNCGSNEFGGITGGRPGDQTGGEWRLRSWYGFGQNVVLVHPDARVNALVADMAEAAARNDRVGYCQAHRTTFHDQLKAAGWRPEKIAADCEADCSSGVAAIVQGAGHRLGIAALQGVSRDCYTGNLRAALVGAGYEARTESRYLTGDAYLPRGAIVLNERKHVNIQVTDGARAGEAAAPGKGEEVYSFRSVRKGMRGDHVSLFQSAYNERFGGSLAVDGSAGPATHAAIGDAQKRLGIAQDYSCGPDTWTHLLGA